ncbi:hypothetical protein FNH22_10105 [Fulvivirga sp. M361]|uniref:hypothetical protein n=1 Tax=Fulvivirga sp. M361 TaxID=2594266 RepID=UPI001179EAE0|nr:hypothetical protein [Fulvivirga sp. M361]TRX59502.1 hypothetical protein FNH22_10105 [Fulvivirga sp. M361]
MKKVIYAFMIVFLGCTAKETTESDMGEGKTIKSVPIDITGTWANLSLKVDIGSDPDSVVDVPAGEWENVLQIKPIVTTFRKDSTFVSEYRNLGDSLFMTSSGVWWMQGDSLFMEEQGVMNSYFVELSTDTATFTAYLDWDQDGDADDLYSGMQIRK